MCKSCQSENMAIFQEGVKTGIQHMDYYSDYYPLLSIFDIESDDLSKAVTIKGQKTQRGEVSFDRYMRELLDELLNEMPSGKQTQQHISSVLKRFSDRKFKDKRWWGDLTKEEVKQLLDGVRDHFSSHTLLLDRGLAEAYKFGKFRELLTESMTLDQARKKVKGLKLGNYDKARLDAIQNTSGLFMDRVIQRQIDNAAIEILEYNRDVITGILKKPDKKTWRSLSSDIYHEIKRDELVTFRDIDRIVRTETAYSQSQAILHDGNDRGKKYAIVRVRESACPICKNMYLDKEGKQKKFLINELLGAGRTDNWGKKPKDFKLTPPPAHPWCYCGLIVLA